MSRFVSVPLLSFSLLLLGINLVVAETVWIDGHRFTVEVARTPAEQEQGLQHRKTLAPNHGMLFEFTPAGAVTFWMKDTLIPLDIIFCRQGKVVTSYLKVPPCPQEQGDNCPVYESEVSIDTVIEVPGGTFNEAPQFMLRFPSQLRSL